MTVEFEDDTIQLSQLNLDCNSSVDWKNNDTDNSLLNVTRYIKEKIKKLQEFFDGKTINQTTFQFDFTKGLLQFD